MRSHPHGTADWRRIRSAPLRRTIACFDIREHSELCEITVPEVAVERLILPFTRRKTSQHGASIRLPVGGRIPIGSAGAHCAYLKGEFHDDGRHQH